MLQVPDTHHSTDCEMRPPLHRECEANCEARPRTDNQRFVKGSGHRQGSDFKVLSKMMHEGPPRPDQSQPLECASGGLEAIDLQILSLLSQRFGLAASTAAQRELSDDERKAQLTVIRRRAFELGIPVGLVTDFWDRLIDAADAIQAQRSNRAIND